MAETRLTRRQLDSFAHARMVQWEKRYNRIKTDDRRDIDDHSAAMAVRYARASAYIARRQAGGTHASGVKAQNAAAARVRRALGFTYKDAPIDF